MTERSENPARISRRDVGRPVTIGRFRLEPVAQVSGLMGGGGKSSGDIGESSPGAKTGSGAGAGAFVRVMPVEVIVHDEEAGETSVAITDLTGQAMRGMAASALLVAVVGGAVMLLAAVLGRRR